MSSTSPSVSNAVPASRASSDSRPVALVTGASSGIGEAMARELASRGWHLVLTARSEDRLEALATELGQRHGIPVEVIVADLADPETPAYLEACTDEAGLPVHLLVNNAGFGYLGPLVEQEVTEVTAMIDVNVRALAELTRRFGGRMAARGEGVILNVASVAAFQPGPLMAVYYATKAFVLSFSEAVHNELAPFGVRVSVLCPGVTRSEFHARAGMQGTTALERLPFASAEEVARFGIDRALAGQPVAVPGIMNRILATSVRFLPRRWVPPVVRKIQERRR